jgi:hypothetical protein
VYDAVVEGFAPLKERLNAKGAVTPQPEIQGGVEDPFGMPPAFE